MNLIFRGMEDMRLQPAEDASIARGLLFDKVVRPLPFAALLLSLLYKASRRTRIELFLLTLISNCPTALARNAAAMIWLPVVVVLFSKKFRHHLFMWIMMFALFVLFPFFNIFRRWNGSIDFSWSMDFLNDINFDASQILMATIKAGFISYGEQLLGALLFFFPRQFWPGKPVGSGSTLVEIMHGNFHNVSMPFFGEGFVNFGYVGILLFTVFLAWLCARMDALYWYKWRQNADVRRGYYLILLGAMIFIMRGDLMSSLAYTVGIMASYALCVWLTTTFRFSRIRLR